MTNLVAVGAGPTLVLATPTALMRCRPGLTRRKAPYGRRVLGCLQATLTVGFKVYREHTNSNLPNPYVSGYEGLPGVIFDNTAAATAPETALTTNAPKTMRSAVHT